MSLQVFKRIRYFGAPQSVVNPNLAVARGILCLHRQMELDMATYTVSLISAESIKDDVKLLAGHKNLWCVEREGRVLAYCVDKGFVDRVTDLSFSLSVDSTGNFFAYPSVEEPVALCTGAVNALLRKPA